MKKKKQRKQLSKRGLALLFLGAGALVLVAGWFLAVSPLRAKANEYDAQTAVTQDRIAANRAAVASASNGTPQIRVADVYRLAAAMPSTDGMPDLLLQVDQAARDAGVTLQTVTPSAPEAQTAGYTSLPISATFDGNFYSITDLLYRLRSLVSVRHGALESRGRLLSVQQVQVSPTEGKRLEAVVNLVAYVYGSDGLVVPGATTSTSTDTTSTATTTSTGASAAGAP